MRGLRKKNILGVLAGLCITLSGCGTNELVFLEDNDVVVAGNHYIATITQEGDVKLVYGTDWVDQKARETDWNGAVRFMKNEDTPVAISEDGTLLVAKGQSYEELEQNMLETLKEIEEAKGNVGAMFGIEVYNAKEMMQWTNLQQVYGNYPHFGGFGICKDGSILEQGMLDIYLSEEEIAQVQSWENIQELATTYSGSYVAGLNSAGEVLTVNYEDISWTDIESIESGRIMLFGLTKEGTVLHSEPGFNREYSTEAMKDIVFIAAGYDNEENLDVVYGITKEGKVVDRFGRELEGFEDIVEIDVTTMSPIVVIGRKADGTICVSENADETMKQAVAEWNGEALSEEVVEELTVKTFNPSEEYVKPLGRTEYLKDTLWMALSGTGAEFSFTGTKAVITMQADTAIMGDRNSQARVAIFVNDECVVDDMIDNMAEIYTVFESETEQECTVRVVKLSEAANSTVGIKNIEVRSRGDIKPTQNKTHLIEFIGDSITCGYGVEDEVKENHFSTKTENVMKAYAYKTAEALDADYSMVSYSGHGIISGYTGTGDKVETQLVPPYYQKFGFSYASYMGQNAIDVEWDFTKRQPDLIVINLGTNDDSYTGSDTAKQEEYVTGYVAFLKEIRQLNPDATILCTLGIMGDRLYPCVEKAVADYQAEAGDEKVHSLKFDVQLPADGYAADWHPTEATHNKAAEKLTTKIKEIMGW